MKNPGMADDNYRISPDHAKQLWDKDGNIAIKKGEEINTIHWSIWTLTQRV